MHLWLTSASSTAFPSGHATQSLSTFAAFALVAAAFMPSARRPGLVVAAVVAAGVSWSRVYLGVHWATDVLAGWLAAACWVALVAWVAHTRRTHEASP
jgi:membrane-associated phospholipid phosphatase